MKAIFTKYLSYTEKKPSRIKAYDLDGHSITMSMPLEDIPKIECHARAAIKLCLKMGWKGKLVSGGTKEGYVFTFSHSESFDIIERGE